MPRSNILLKRLMAPKKVQLPNGLVFHVKHQMVSRNVLPKRIRVRKIGPQRQEKQRNQVGPGMPTQDLISNVEIEKGFKNINSAE